MICALALQFCRIIFCWVKRKWLEQKNAFFYNASLIIVSILQLKIKAPRTRLVQNNSTFEDASVKSAANGQSKVRLSDVREELTRRRTSKEAKLDNNEGVAEKQSTSTHIHLYHLYFRMQCRRGHDIRANSVKPMCCYGE